MWMKTSAYINSYLLLLAILKVCFIYANKVIVIGFDGFRYDYVNHYKTPNLDAMAKNGVFCLNGMRASFPTKTFPNFYSLATGLYIENHGIVDNSFYDPKFKEKFSMFRNRTAANDPKWWLGEPIWVTAKKQGKKSGTFFWVGSEVSHKAMQPDTWRPYNARVDYKERIDTAVSWLADKDYDLAMVYYDQPDTISHKMGAFHKDVENMVHLMDSLIGHLMIQLKARNLLSTTNIIVVSDHGIRSLNSADSNSVIDLSRYLNFKEEVYAMPNSGAIATLVPKWGKEYTVYRKLKGVNENMEVYRKHEIPERFHYKNSSRIPPIILIPKEGFIVRKNNDFPPKTYIGQHGYDNALPSMRPLFYAQGPDIRPGLTVDTFDNVNIYVLICWMLNIKPAVNDGDIRTFENILY